jgi:endonuclease-8
MPEGDTIFRSARTLHLALAGHAVVRFETRYAHLQRAHDDAPITGRRVEAVASRGKHLLMTFSGGLVLRTHMRMSGSWHVYRPGEPWKLPRDLMRIVVATAAFEAIAFNVQDAEFVEAPALARGPVGRLGPDLLAPDFDEAEALRRLRARDAGALGDVLLDQRVVAGIGNVYRSEVLFLTRRNPATPIRTLADDELRALLALARRLLLANVLPTAGPGIATRHSLRRTTARDAPEAALWVYQREGQPCRACGTPIARARRGPDARTTWWCPRCQPAPAL